MELDKRDVIAVADARVYRKISRVIWLTFVVAAAISLVLLYFTAHVVALVSPLAIWLVYFFFILNKRQKAERNRLLKEWEDGKIAGLISERHSD